MHFSPTSLLAELRSSVSIADGEIDFHRANSLTEQEVCGHDTSLLEDSSQPARIRRISYRTIAELRSLLRGEDQPDVGFCQTVVIQLDDEFEGSLPDLVARRHVAMRLIMTTPSGKLRGPHSKGDLAMCAGSLGWHTIVCRRQSDEELDDVLTSLEAEDDCIVFYPANRE